MDPFTASYLAGVISSLTTNVLGHRLRDSIRGTEKEQALKRCFHAGMVAIVTTASSESKEEQALLADIFKKFFEDEDVSKEIVSLLRGRQMDRKELAYCFENAGYDAETLPGVDFNRAITYFEAAFLAASTSEEILQGIIQTNQLLQQTHIQHEMLNTMREMVKFLKDIRPESLIIQPGAINALKLNSNDQVTYTLLGGALRQSYLNRLFQTTRQLHLTGIDPKAASSEAQARLNLDAVYTALRTLTPEIQEGLQRGEALEKDARYLSALEQLNKHPMLVLLGDPGSGKSTFVNFVTLCLVGEAIGQKNANLTLLTAPLLEEDEDKAKPQPWDHGALLPVRVILRDFAARDLPGVNKKATAEHLWKFIKSELRSAALGEYATHLRRELLTKGGLLLLDGLDEVPEAEQRRTQIKQAVEDFAASFPHCRILVTSRTYAYQKQDWRLPDFAETVLAPFCSAQIRSFVEHWYVHVAATRGMNAEDSRGRAELLKRAIFGSERLLALAERPLLLTLMASLHAWCGGSLPEKREELYADTVDLLLDWWESPKMVRDADGNVKVLQPSLAEWLKVDRQKVRDLLNELAYQAHESQPELVGTADIPENSLVNVC